jgi:predicted ATP-dependent endonuclease of OLD family
MTGNHIKIKNLKGIGSLDFEIPKSGVHIITASNGSGKTTLIVCLERLTNTSAFSKHFIQQKSWNVDSYDESEITYISKKGNSVTYTYRSVSDSWRPIKKDIKAIKDFGYTDVITIPTLGKRVYTQSQTIKGGQVKAATNSLREAISEVLENPKFLSLLKINLGEIRGRGGANRRNNTAFLLPKGTVRKNNKQTRTYYSESIFSLVEIFSLNLLFELEVIRPNYLLVIDELEFELHPRVQIILLKFLEKKSV